MAVSSAYISMLDVWQYLEIRSQPYWLTAPLYRNLSLVTFPNIRLSEHEKWVQKWIRHNVPKIALCNEKYRWDFKARNCVDIRKTPGNQLTQKIGLRAVTHHSLRKIWTINPQFLISISALIVKEISMRPPTYYSNRGESFAMNLIVSFCLV